MKRAVLVLVLAALALAGCPKRVKPKNATHVWLGVRHGCATWTTGETACWGRNDKGQLGANDKRDSQVPVVVTGIAPPIEMALGLERTCARFSDGAVKCWGAQTDVMQPARQVVAAGESTCALLADSVECGAAFRWAGVSGHNPSHIAMSEGMSCVSLESPREVDCGAKKLLAGAEVLGLTAGATHACALLSDRSVRCWGANDAGQLGDGTTSSSDAPVIVTGLGDVSEVHAGDRHTCALLRNGTVSCWGKNDRSQLANGTKDPSSRPIGIFGLTGIKELAVAGDSACALLGDGEIRCWGANDFGQLGDGTKTEHNVPAAVRSPR